MCGKTEDEAKFANSKCTECYAKQVDVRYETAGLKMCSICEKLIVANKTEALAEESLTAIVRKNLKSKDNIVGVTVEFNRIKNAIEFNGIVKIEASGIIVEKPLNGTIRVAKTACSECNKKTGGYFEAIIQIRSDNKKRAEQFATGIIKKIEDDSFIAKIDELKNGFDLYVGNKKTALKAVQEFKLPFTTSSKLAGRKDGNDLYRTTFCVRI